MHFRHYVITKLNASEIVFGIKATKFQPNENMCFYSNSFLGTYEVFNVYLSPFFKRSSFCSKPILIPFTATTFFLNVCKNTSPSVLLICPILLQNYLFKSFLKNWIEKIFSQRKFE